MFMIPQVIHFYPYIVTYELQYASTNELYGNWNNNISTVNNTVMSLHYSATGSQPGLYAGGHFTTAGTANANANYTAWWDGSAWYPLPYLPGVGPGQGVNAVVYSVKYDNTNVIVGGGSLGLAFESNSYVIIKFVAFYEISSYSWSPMEEIVEPYGVKKATNPSGIVYAVIEYLGIYYVGGDFTNAGGIYANNIARYDPVANIWYPFIDSNTQANGVNGIVRALYAGSTSGDSGLYVGGEFTTAGTAGDLPVLNYVARWDISTGNHYWAPLTDSNTGGQEQMVLFML